MAVGNINGIGPLIVYLVDYSLHPKMNRREPKKEPEECLLIKPVLPSEHILSYDSRGRAKTTIIPQHNYYA